MRKSAMKCNETLGKWCKNKHGASKIIDTFETYHAASERRFRAFSSSPPPPLREDPVRPIWPPPRLIDVWTCWRRARGGSVVRGARGACRRREIAAEGAEWEGIAVAVEIRLQPASTPSTAIYDGRRVADAGTCIVFVGQRPDAVSNLRKKIGPDPQIGLGGAIRARLRGLLELLLAV
jgi:hypothetical protein